MSDLGFDYRLTMPKVEPPPPAPFMVFPLLFYVVMAWLVFQVGLLATGMATIQREKAAMTVPITEKTATVAKLQAECAALTRTKDEAEDLAHWVTDDPRIVAAAIEGVKALPPETRLSELTVTTSKSSAPRMLTLSVQMMAPPSKATPQFGALKDAFMKEGFGIAKIDQTFSNDQTRFQCDLSHEPGGDQ